LSSEGALTFVGNDIIDLTAPRLGDRAHDQRLWDRVLDPSERSRVEHSADSSTAFLRHWAAKEAAFKALSKAAGRPPVFAHRSFVADLDEESDSGALRYGTGVCTIRLECSSDVIHALAWTGAARERASGWTHAGFSDALDPRTPGSWVLDTELAELLHPDERPSVRHAASAWARILAREALSGALGCPKDSIAILGDPEAPGRAPPRVRIEGYDPAPDLSLSHHGRLVAWAFLLSDATSSTGV
jgi:4'-phosphopantetheinyl transferase superfamily